nr:ABC transporter ATP-binding protein [Leptospira yasudae]
MQHDIAISIKNVSKIFKVYDKPRYRLQDFLRPVLKKIHARFDRKYYREYVALKNVSFDLKKGESIGFIGRNGAGKSTLLQIIAGTLTPTTGEVTVNGRINALLELGSGFNPEFTGRENVYLNGSILGYSKELIDAKFQEIHEFSEIGEFIDQPVKTYSSGMYVKLAFSVQALLDPDILIVDEALSVGDVFFQRKCNEIIQKLLGGNTTFIFVSHDMSSISKYCQKVVFLDKGEVLYSGDSRKAINLYFNLERMTPEEIKLEGRLLDSGVRPEKLELTKLPDSQIGYSSNYAKVLAGTFSEINFIGHSILNEWNYATNSFTVKDKCRLSFIVEAKSDIDCPIISVSIYNRQNVVVYGKFSYQFADSKIPKNIKKGDKVKIDYTLQLDLYPDEYIYNIALGKMNADDLDNISNFSISEYQDRYFHFVTIEIGVFRVNIPSRGIYLPFNGLTDLPGDCSHFVLNSDK